MQIWTHDTALGDAVELAKDFLAVVDVLNALWPCKCRLKSHSFVTGPILTVLPAANQAQTDNLRKQLIDACGIMGTEPPLPPTYATSLIRI